MPAGPGSLVFSVSAGPALLAAFPSALVSGPSLPFHPLTCGLVFESVSESRSPPFPLGQGAGEEWCHRGLQSVSNGDVAVFSVGLEGASPALTFSHSPPPPRRPSHVLPPPSGPSAWPGSPCWLTITSCSPTVVAWWGWQLDGVVFRDLLSPLCLCETSALPRCQPAAAHFQGGSSHTTSVYPLLV